jgi:hypothetical protein
MPHAGVIKNLAINVDVNTIDNAGHTATVTFTVMKNGVATAVTCTFPNQVVGKRYDNAHSVAFAKGDMFEVVMTHTGATGGTISDASGSVDYERS